jgi:GDPmannose 4,6-dehydratase
MSPKALIVGSGGQDGRLLSEFLAAKGYRILGLTRGGMAVPGLGGEGSVDITNAGEVLRLVDAVHPDEVYHLAAFHHSADSAPPAGTDLLRRSIDVNLLSLGHFLEALRQRAPAARLFYAASSQVFGEPAAEPQDETTPLAPTTIYGISKAAAVFLCRAYRRDHGFFASAGILYNHESIYRPAQFVSMKIVDGAIAVMRGERRELVLGDLGAEVDWGYAGEYVQAMHRILQLDGADEFVVATGRKHSVQEFAAIAFELVGLDWRKHVREARPGGSRRVHRLVGDPRKLRARAGWEAAVQLPELVRLLMRGRGIAV